MYIAMAAMVSLLASFISGLFGGGAGLLTVPGFYWILAHHYPDAQSLMQTTIAIGCWLSIPLGIVATWRQLRYNNIDLPMLKLSLAPMLIGAFVGALLLNFTQSHIVKYTFSAFVFFTAIWMMRYNIEQARQWSPSKFMHNAVCFFTALISGALGVSVFFVPFFIKLGLDIRKAIGTSTVIVFVYALINAVALVVMGLNQPDLPPGNWGYLNIPIFLAGIIPSIIGGLLAVKMVNTIPRQYIKSAFVMLMFIVSILMALPRT